MLHYEIIRNTERLVGAIERVIRHRSSKMLLLKCEETIYFRDNKDKWVYVVSLKLLSDSYYDIVKDEKSVKSYNPNSEICCHEAGIILSQLIDNIGRGVYLTSDLKVLLPGEYSDSSKACQDCKMYSMQYAKCPTIDLFASSHSAGTRRSWNTHYLFVHDLLRDEAVASKSNCEKNEEVQCTYGGEKCADLYVSTVAGIKLKTFASELKDKALKDVQKVCYNKLHKWLSDIVCSQLKIVAIVTDVEKAREMRRRKRCIDRLLNYCLQTLNSQQLQYQSNSSHKDEGARPAAVASTSQKNRMLIVNICHMMSMLLCYEDIAV